MNILIVDDDPANLKLLRAQLEAQGYAVLEAANGVEALEVLGHEPVVGVISDILMPDMDGYQLCMEVRKSSNFGALPLVLYTGTYTSPSDRALAFSVGADAYIQKPTPIQTILDTLHTTSDRTQKVIRSKRARKALPDVLKRYNEVLVRKLEEKHEYAKAALERAQLMAKLAHVVTGPDGSFEHWSETLPRMIGVEPDHLPRTVRAWLDILHPDDRSLIRDKVIEARVKKRRTEFEYRLRRFGRALPIFGEEGSRA